MTDSYRFFLDTPSGQVLARRARATGARPLLLCQLLPFASRLWAPALPLLAARGWDAVAFDMMGYGGSDKRGGAWDVARFADHIGEVMDALGWASAPVVAGHFSVLPAVELALRGRASALALDGPPLASPEMRAKLKASGGILAPAWTPDGAHMTALWGQAYAMLSRLVPSIEVGEATRPAFSGLLADFIESMVDPSIVAAVVDHDLEASLKAVTVPALVIGAEHDSQVHNVAPVRALLGDGPSHLFPGAHPLHDATRTDRAGDYASVLADWLDQAAR